MRVECSYRRRVQRRCLGRMGAHSPKDVTCDSDEWPKVIELLRVSRMEKLQERLQVTHVNQDEDQV